jgi:post-segregation antitoxin (ccd killing protein)
MVQVINFEKASEKAKTTMVSVPSDIVKAIRKAYPEINLSATVRASLQEILDKPTRNSPAKTA